MVRRALRSDRQSNHMTPRRAPGGTTTAIEWPTSTTGPPDRLTTVIPRNPSDKNTDLGGHWRWDGRGAQRVRRDWGRASGPVGRVAAFQSSFQYFISSVPKP